MFKQVGRGVVVLFAAGFVSQAALAADLAKMPRKAPAAFAAYNWTGLYLGANAGVGVSGTTATSDPVNAPGTDDIAKSGFTGGGQVGYNWQFAPSWVAGVEADLNGLSGSRNICIIANCTGGANQFDLTSRTSWIGTARGRLGFAFNQSMIYGTAGFARVRTTDEWSNYSNTPRVIETNTKNGWAAGGGVETALVGNWTAKAEYLYVNAGTSRLIDPAAPANYVEFKHQYHLARVGLNYRFGGTPASQVYASAGAPVANWQGFYVGVNAGVGASNTRFDAPNQTVAGVTDTVDIFGAGFAGGAQAGYNWQAGRAVFGVEGDFGGLGVSRSFTSMNTQYIPESKTDWAGTVRGRFGYAFDRSLLFATAGAAAVHVTDSVTNGGSTSVKKTKGGWTVGGGIETALVANWTVKAEYLYIDVGTVSNFAAGVTTAPGVDYKHTYHVARLGLNYLFH